MAIFCGHIWDSVYSITFCTKRRKVSEFVVEGQLRTIKKNVFEPSSCGLLVLGLQLLFERVHQNVVILIKLSSLWSLF